MLLFALVPPAQVAQAPEPAKLLARLQEQLEAVPEALIEGRKAALPGLVADLQSTWAQALPVLGTTLPEPERLSIGRQLKAMPKMKPREQAVGALGVSTMLARHQAKSREQELRQAGHAAMLAWCQVDAGQAGRLPGVADAFQAVLAQDNGQYAQAAGAVQQALKRLQDSQSKRDAAGAKKALKELLGQVDVFNKP